MRRFILPNLPVIALVVLMVLLVSILVYASSGTSRRRIELVAVSLLLGLGIAVAVYQGTAPTYCPKFGDSIIGPERDFCVREEFLTPRYLSPAGILFAPTGPSLPDPAGSDITPPGFLFWYPLIWIGTSLAVGLLMVRRQRFRSRKSEAPGRRSQPLDRTGP